MKANTKTGKSERNLGVIAAVAAAGFFMLVIGWFVLRGSPSVATAGAGGGGNPGGPGGQAPPPEKVPDIAELEGTGNLDLELTAKDDPTRLVATIQAESFEPVGVNERAVEKPTVWVFLEDGRFGLVEASRGRFFMPTPGAAPESGMLNGTAEDPVRLRLFEATPDGSKPDAASVPPLLTAEFSEPLEFDMRHARVSSVGKFRVFSPEVEFRGTYLTAMLNQVKQRLELVEVRQGESLTYTALSDRERKRLEKARGSRADAKGQRAARADGTASISDPQRGRRQRPTGPATADATAPAPDAAGGPAEPKRDYYRAVFADGVRVTQEGRTITADALDLWVRLVNNALPEGAIADLAFEGGEQAESDEGEPAPQSGAETVAADAEPAQAAPIDDPVLAALAGGTTAAPGEQATEQAADRTGATGARPARRGARPAASPESIVLTWTGPLLIKPLPDEAPAELANDDVRLRMTAERTGMVEFADAQSGATGRSVSLDYGFTSAELVFSGPGGNVDMTMPGSGNFVGSRMMTNLRAGTVHVRGPGVMRVDGEGDDAAAPRIRWAEQADFDVAVVDGRLTSDLERAAFAGSVEATDGEATLNGEFILAAFVGTPDGGRRLAQLDVEKARTDDGRGGRLVADSARVDFADGTLGHDMDPVRLVATGNVRGGKDGSSITAQEVTAELERQLDGEVGATSVAAAGQAQYTGADGTYAAGDSIDADVVGEVITLLGSPARVGQHGTGISGPEILVDGRNRRARVIGAGSFEHKAAGGGGQDPADVLATWSEGMAFDDYAGRVEAYGAASAVSKPDALTRDTVNAERILIELTPSTGDSQESAGEGAQRRLVRATAFGSVDMDQTVRPASVESRVYAQDDAERVEQLFYLEGMQIVADNERGRLTVPEAGKLLILDRRRNGAERSREGDGGLMAELASGGPGLTRFEWRGGMTMDRNDGTATMRRTVRVNHKALLAGERTELHCEKLTAQIRQRDADGRAVQATDAVKGELTQAEAAGAVYFKSGDRELIADRLLYDAVNGRAIATAAPGNLVSLFDAARATPVSSRALSWDLIRDRIEIERPSPVVTPGNLP